jgi:hypothetical protein
VPLSTELNTHSKRIRRWRHRTAVHAALALNAAAGYDRSAAQVTAPAQPRRGAAGAERSARRPSPPR